MGTRSVHPFEPRAKTGTGGVQPQDVASAASDSAFTGFGAEPSCLRTTSCLKLGHDMGDFESTLVPDSRHLRVSRVFLFFCCRLDWSASLSRRTPSASS